MIKAEVLIIVDQPNGQQMDKGNSRVRLGRLKQTENTTGALQRPLYTYRGRAKSLSFQMMWNVLLDRTQVTLGDPCVFQTRKTRSKTMSS